MRTLHALCLVLVAATAPWPLAAQAPAMEPLWLRPGDGLRLEIGDEPHLSGDFTVSLDGRVLLPIIGLVPVVGRPFEDVRADVVSAYRGKLVDTPVVVTPLLRIAVLGEVRQPGLWPVDPTYTVADVIAAAGGITPLGDGSRITITGDGEPIEFSLTDDPDVLARPLRPGDQILVPRRSWVRENLGVLLGAAASVLAAAVTSWIIR